jgi:hypothetical protein
VGAQLKRTAHPVLFQTISEREVLEAVPILPLDSEHRISFRKVIYPKVEKLCPNSLLVIASDRRERGNLFIFNDE